MKLFPCNSEISHYKVAEKLLDSGIMMIRLLRDRPGVVLPDFLTSPIVNLNFSYRFGIDDFEVDADGIRASLSFSGTPHFCDIPWSAVCSMVSEVTGQIFVWLDVFNEKELAQFFPPNLKADLKEATLESLLVEFPELEEFVEKDEPQKDDEEEEEEEDDFQPGGFTPLHFV